MLGGRRECLVPAPSLEEIRAARRKNSALRPALTRHTPPTHPRRPGAGIKGKSVQK